MKIKNTKRNLAKLELLRIIYKLKATDRKIVIDNLDRNAIDTLCETVSNVFYNDIKIGKRRKKKLYRHFKDKEDLIDKLSNKSIDFKRRKKILAQEGGSLGIVL